MAESSASQARAPGAPRHVLETPFAQLRRGLVRLGRAATPGAVHDVRVAARRLLSVLDVLEPQEGAPAAARARHERTARAARRLVRTLAPVREADVRAASLRALMAGSRIDAGARREWLRIVQDGQRRARCELASRLRDPAPRFVALLLDPRLPGALARVAPPPAVIARRAARQARRLRRRLARVDGTTRRLHRARLAVKRLRYLDESLAPFVANSTTIARRSVLRRLQRRLGAFRDLWSLRRWLLEQAVDGLAARELEAEAHRRLRAARAESLHACARHADSPALVD